jgi:cytoskeleton protein RodZ
MATRRKRNLNFLPAESRAEPVIDISAYPVDIGVGELMRLTRERLGHELQTVANQLRIRLSYLEAIEDARFRDLPGTTYAVGFVRSYADYLGLDGADIVRRFREEAARIHGQTKLVFPALTAEGKLPRAAVLLVSAIGLAAVYGVWYYISSRQQSDLPVITDVPDRLVVLPPDGGSAPEGPAPDRPQDIPDHPFETPAPLSAPTDSQPATSGESPSAAAGAGPQPPAAPVESESGAAIAVTPPGSAGEVPVSATSGTDASISPPASPVAPSAPATDANGSTATVTPTPPVAGTNDHASAISTDSAAASAVPAGQPSTAAPAAAVPPAAPAVTANDIPAAPAAPAVPIQDGSPQIATAPPAEMAAGVVLEARMDSWIKVVDANGKTVTNKVLKAGERYMVPDQPGLVLRTGNAGGLDVLVNGQKAPPLGDVGAVLTKISLAPDRLLDGTAATN